MAEASRCGVLGRVFVDIGGLKVGDRVIVAGTSR
jgi:hypothetical protein